jgi:Na+/phosphate symporter
LDQLSALRNFAAHRSAKSKKAALKAINGERISTSGAWLKTNDRFLHIVSDLKKLADEIENFAPY